MNANPLLQYSLAEIETKYRYGSITEEELNTYLKAWNATPCRFTTARWCDGAIRQTVKP